MKLDIVHDLLGNVHVYVSQVVLRLQPCHR